MYTTLFAGHFLGVQQMNFDQPHVYGLPIDIYECNEYVLDGWMNGLACLCVCLRYLLLEKFFAESILFQKHASVFSSAITVRIHHSMHVDAHATRVLS